MDTTNHTLPALFSQLGLPSEDSEIKQFIKQHYPLEKNIELAQASWWNNAQREFVREAISTDSDWAIIVDQLDTQLRNNQHQKSMS